jgi:hypothetical protein
MAVITDQLTRLDVLESGQVGYLGWCKRVESLLHSEDRRPRLSKLELAQKKEEFSASCELSQCLRSLVCTCNKWVQRAIGAIYAPPSDKQSKQDAKLLLDGIFLR